MSSSINNSDNDPEQTKRPKWRVTNWSEYGPSLVSISP